MVNVDCTRDPFSLQEGLNKNMYFIKFAPTFISITETRESEMLMEQIAYWFSKYMDGFYKFKPPCCHIYYPKEIVGKKKFLYPGVFSIKCLIRLVRAMQTVLLLKNRKIKLKVNSMPDIMRAMKIRPIM